MLFNVSICSLVGFMPACSKAALGFIFISWRNVLSLSILFTKSSKVIYLLLEMIQGLSLRTKVKNPCRLKQRVQPGAELCPVQLEALSPFEQKPFSVVAMQCADLRSQFPKAGLQLIHSPVDAFTKHPLFQRLLRLLTAACFAEQVRTVSSAKIATPVEEVIHHLEPARQSLAKL